VRVDSEMGDFLGVFKAVLNLNEIIDVVRRTKHFSEYDTTDLALIKKDGSIIYQTTPGYDIFKKFSYFDTIELAEHGQGKRFYSIRKKRAGTEELIVHAHSKGYKNFKGLGWALIIAHDKTEIFAPIVKLQLILISVLLAFMIAGFIIGIYFLHTVIDPIEKLVDASRRIGTGDFSARVSVKTKDEINILAESFNKMSEELSFLMAKLRDSNYLNQLVLNTIPIGIHIVDCEGNIMMATPPMKKMFGENIIGRKCWSVYRDDQTQCRTCPLITGVAPGETASMEVRGVKGDRVYHVTHVGMIYENKRAALELFQDITERKAADSLLRESEEKWRSLTENSPDHILMVDHEGIILFINRTVPDLTTEDVIGKSIFEFVSENEVPAMKETFSEVMRTGNQGTYSNEYHGQDGSVRYFESRVNLFKTNDQTIAFVVSATDITERKKAEDTIRENSIKLKTLLGNIPGMVYRGGADWSVEIISGSLNICGYTPEEINGSHGKWLEIIHPDDRDRVIAEGELLIREKITLTQIYRIIEKTGRVRHVEDRKTSLFSGKGHLIGIDGIIFDITERTIAEQKKRELFKEKMDAEAKFLQSEKLAGIGRLAAGTAHEINSPLAGLLGLIRLHRNKMAEGTPEYDELTLMLDAANYISKIVSNLTSFARPSQGHLTDIDLHDVLESTLSFSIRELTKCNITIVKEYAEHLPQIKGDKHQLQHVVLNMVSNAQGAMPEGGIFTLRTRYHAEENRVILEFADTGCGIPEENIPKIFDPFFTTKEPGKGVGLGLSVVHGIIQNYHGTITVESTVGSGAAFRIAFPAA